MTMHGPQSVKSHAKDFCKTVYLYGAQ